MAGAADLLMALMGAGSWKIKLSGASIPDEELAPSDAFASVVVRSDGTVDAVTSGGTAQLSPTTDWIVPNQFAPGGATPASVGGSVKATLLSGDTPSGTLNSFLALTEDRQWSLSQSGAGSKSCQIKLEIGIGPNNTVMASGTYTLTASVS